jgi:transaldolase
MDLSRDSLSIKLFADGADLQGMTEMAAKPYITGLTTNPTLMNKAGIRDYRKFAHEVLSVISQKLKNYLVLIQHLTLKQDFRTNLQALSKS